MLTLACEELTHWKRLWCWEGLGAGGEGDDRGWDGWTASLTRWTWVWVNSSSWWWTGKPGVLRFMGSQRVGHDWATELNWTEGTTSAGFCTSSHPYHLSSKHNEFLEIEFKKGHSKKTIIVLLPHQSAPAYSSIHSKRYYRPTIHQKRCSSLMLKQREGLVHSSGAHSTREGRNRRGIMIQ